VNGKGAARSKRILTGIFTRGAPQTQEGQPQQQQSQPQQKGSANPLSLNQTYYKSSSDEVERQLIKAGLRLASVLNQIFK
jgi:hypothetical protein